MAPQTPPCRQTVALPLGEELLVSAGARWLTLRIRRVGGDAAPLADGLMVPIDKLAELRRALDELAQALPPAP